MSQAWNLDFSTNRNRDEIDNGGRAPDGFYKANLAEVEDDQEDGAKLFKFKVSEGPYAGVVHTERISNPMMADTPAKAATIIKRAKLFASRLGLVSDSDLGRVSEINFDRAAGVPVVIHLKTNKFTGKDGSQKEFQNLAFDGVYPFDHPDVPQPVRMSLGLPAARARTGAAGAKGATPAGGTAPAATAPTSAGFDPSKLFS